MTSAEQELTEAVARQKLNGSSAAVLTQIAQDPHGMEKSDAPSMLASLTHLSLTECQAALIDLLARQLVVEAGVDRLTVNFETLGIGVATRQQLQAQIPVYEDLGNPHAPKAMGTLDQMFDQERGPVYLCLEITSPVVFKRLSDRAAIGRRTIFLIPKKAHVRSERQRHYDETLNEWRQLLRSTVALRKNTEIRLMRELNPALYTSALTARFARFDLYRYDMETTRKGRLIVAEKGTSLYDAIYALYARAEKNAPPLFFLWPARRLRFHLRRYWIPIAFLVLILLISYELHWKWISFLLGVATSLVATVGHEAWKNWTGSDRDLF